MKLDSLPFHIGAVEISSNPAGLPDTWPFSLCFDHERGAITQVATPELTVILEKPYLTGHLIGTPLDDDRYGKPYADDFLNFIQQLGLPQGSSAMEIGAGVGYVTRRLNELGMKAIGIEPGRGYASHWKKHGVEIVNDFFPTVHISGQFDIICSYAVLEHITEPILFLKNVREHLAPDGIAVFSVPDCTDEIIAGDPSILFHEHFSYFDAGSLARLIRLAGMKAKVTKSQYGRCLYALAGIELDESGGEVDLDVALVASYPERCQYFIQRVQDRMSKMLMTGTLGVYCAARGLPILDQIQTVRFFDDDPLQQGRYLPPFKTPIESRESLIINPVDHLVIMSRTFGQRIRDNLRQQGYQGSIVTLDEI